MQSTLDIIAFGKDDVVFDYKMTPTKVKIHMKNAIGDGSFWTFVKRL